MRTSCVCILTKLAFSPHLGAKQFTKSSHDCTVWVDVALLALGLEDVNDLVEKVVAGNSASAGLERDYSVLEHCIGERSEIENTATDASCSSKRSHITFPRP